MAPLPETIWKRYENVYVWTWPKLRGRRSRDADVNLYPMLYPQTNLLPELEPYHVEPIDLKRCKVAVSSRWTAEYVHDLRETHNLKCGKKPAIAQCDVVIIQGDDKNMNLWKLWIVKELIVGQDGTVRAAKLKAGEGTLDTAVQHLYPLELSCNKTVSGGSRGGQFGQGPCAFEGPRRFSGLLFFCFWDII